MKKLALLIAAISLICTSCSVMCSRKSVLDSSRWTAESKMFVADAGYETTTATLDFLPGGKFSLKVKSVLPSHPAMYMNADGSVDTIPGHSSEYEQKGTYRVSGDKCTLTYEDGSSRELILQGSTGDFSKGGGSLLGNIYGFEPFFFHREK